MKHDKACSVVNYGVILKVCGTSAVYFYLRFKGHNWGSPHDSDSSESCFPSSSQGGKYLMCPISVGGDDSNNFVCVIFISLLNSKIFQRISIVHV